MNTSYEITSMELGPMENFIYLITDLNTRQAAVVDPAWDVKKIIAQAQEEDGYLQTHTTINKKYDFSRDEKSGTAPRNVGETNRYANRKFHEMYNHGHLFTSACIHYRATGKRNFLDIAIKQADLLCQYFLRCPSGI